METKKYSSYAEINHDLEILRLEKEIHYKKMLLSIDKTKESFLPSKTVSLISDIYQKATSGMLGTILKIAIPYAINWYINRKRGD
ncbi:DUF6327 family protein [Flavobacterium sp. AS60]|uniref:DUF6327 family protein n=1 Tax=Flavobacterium anseongense TaxID=2910677 RepID=UPI001F1BAC36|nr:DUF6327 family protein [Flavobacterium sp. AS60]MCF6129811.1 DUF6327 family protein [Flavobacterium sp. AS60]